MSKRDDDNEDDDEGYDIGDLAAGMLIAATATAIGVAALLLPPRRRVRAAPVVPPTIRAATSPIEFVERARTILEDEEREGANLEDEDGVPNVGRFN